MTVLGEVIFGVLMAIGLVGILVPVLPGALLILGAAVMWALQVGGAASWAVVVAMALLIGTGTVVKYQLPGRELAELTVSRGTWVLALVLAVVGFFVVPVVGLVLGFVLGVYLGQRRSGAGHRVAWLSTKRILASIGKGIAIEFVAAFAAVATWVLAVVVWL